MPPGFVNVSDVPWNVALASILKSQDLDVQVIFKTQSLNGKIHRRCS